ncbi:5-methyltetrahydropteroyltriglutamate--homocysteine S-methyltransferase [Sporolactobacillus laevolacticus]|uniref:5-methyltetrahydropteroyltriglutamate--homocysteine methyltransferase n=1 Tax=Sporolactobacillus laevolacticus DSM 442 TaxID=1395513 RepID=V6ITW3_9BACL|nr:5-methyltetrahydropteroyltriglutamate--homocysteine S-methyltransferase [Sporolactobacillus laevolacticus]EST10287.1 5-methyltetrahydropteroyltriglutamate--homocysteine methyltransferase [Sporolactobacillus laevolacticus DSM 442]
MGKVLSANLGYPRIGEKREWKKALEQFWAGKITKETFLETVKTLRLSYLKKQKELGLDLIPVGDFSLYDHVLDTAVLFGLIPDRFRTDEKEVSLETYFSIARGSKNAEASEMTKWFNTNYHYIVPEISNDTKPYLTSNRLVELFNEAKEAFGIVAKPVIVGPITVLKLAKGYDQDHFRTLLDALIPLYVQVLSELQAAGAEWVQIDEPILVKEQTEEDLALFQDTYKAIKNGVPSLNILLQTYFEAVDDYEKVVQLPVDGIGLDFVYGKEANLAAIKAFGFPKEKVLAAGVIDGRNIWKTDLSTVLHELKTLLTFTGGNDKLWVTPSSSLLHVPVTVSNETELDPVLLNALSFADEKLKEIVTLANGLNEGEAAIEAALQKNSADLQALQQSAHRNNKEVQKEISRLSDELPARPGSFKLRQQIQADTFKLPPLPTTTIGSFPQTKEVRQARRNWRKGEWSEEQYEQFIKDETAKWIQIQEDIGIDVLVHGEFERNDMVEYFGEKLAGFAFTRFGWVQSYGSRCVKPPLIFGDVSWKEAMTVKESAYAQSLTKSPVKGMLTGPVTIYNWSFVRDDISQADVFNQIALALKNEVRALEEADIRMIQVDEPALREGLPLKEEKKAGYLHDAVYSFRLATSFVNNDTQIHTHMCYSEFDEIIETIDALDTDVISIEAARSHGEIISAFEDFEYKKGIGLGVYDIHSPRIPSVDEMKSYAERALKVLDPKVVWINPDCGLKTRRPEETIPALKNMVEAAQEVRNELSNRVGK